MIAAIFQSAVLSSNFWINTGITVGLAGIFTLGIQLNAGTTGIINVGQGGFMAMGAYAMGILVVQHGLSLWVAMVAATLITMTVSLLLGAVSLRLRADYFAIATIAFAEIIRMVIVNETPLTGGNQGLYGFDSAWGNASAAMSSLFARHGFSNLPQLPLLVVSWATFAVLLLLIRYLSRTPWGRSLAAVREDEHAAAALGLNTVKLKLQSLAIAAALGAIAGYIFALQIRFLVPTEFDATITFLAYAALILGGLGSYSGVLVGTVVVYVLLELTTFLNVPLSVDAMASARYIVVGVVLVVLCLLRPQGLLGKRSEMLARE